MSDLTSRTMGLAQRNLPEQWQEKYGYHLLFAERIAEIGRACSRRSSGLSLELVSRLDRVDGTFWPGHAGNQGKAGEFNESEFVGLMFFQKRPKCEGGHPFEPGESDVRMK
jgi:hypothetical protein